MKRTIRMFIFWGIFNLISPFSFAQTPASQDGSKLWFSCMKPTNQDMENPPWAVCIQQESPTFQIIRVELKAALDQLFNASVSLEKKAKPGSVVVGTSASKIVAQYVSSDELKSLGEDGFILRMVTPAQLTLIAANTEKGALYGTFHYLRLLQTASGPLNNLDVKEIPSYQRRILNHWDNLDRTVERGYAGHSIWEWNELPEKISPRYTEYARVNASIGINGTVLNNVNANPEILTENYLKKVKAIANVLRPWGIKVYLAVNFSSPKAIGGLSTSDPLSDEVKTWWKNKASEIYQLIPDFGGFLVKANSEGLPGPQDFGRSHADGANMLAEALEPFGGIVMWRAFVYSPGPDDRAKQAYTEFMPLDGKFRKNVIIQVKNGPVDFQPREPFSPLFGAMKHTTLMPELQITQEYLGFSTHLVYLGTMFKEFLDADTYVQGRSSTVARITDGSMFNDSVTAIAGVANIGEDTNWCGHHFAQANWYVFGRLAWNNQLGAKEIAREWLKQTFTHNQAFIDDLSKVMMQSRDAAVDYMTPLGLHHLMGWSHHYGPEPWCSIPGARPDWMPSYYHKADSAGIGFDRSSKGSNAVQQYAQPLRAMFDDPQLCPEAYLLWFHHLSWDYTLRNGNDLWTELCYKYSGGVDAVRRFQNIWNTYQSEVDAERFEDIRQKLAIQEKEAVWWRDACLLYFQTFSHRPIPDEVEQPVHQLDQLRKLKFDLKSHN